MSKQIRVAAFNTEHCADQSKKTGEDLPVDISATASVITALCPDTVGLEEMYERSEREDLRDQTRKLAALAGFPNYRFAEGKYFEWKDSIGNALMTKYPLISVDEVHVPAPLPEERPPEQNEWYEDRVLLKAVVDYDGCKVMHIVTHFGLNPCEQENIVRAIVKEIDASPYPVILSGDFNATPDSEILAPIRARLSDVARALGNHDFTFASYNPYTVIDYIFVSEEIEPKAFGVDNRLVSDHFAIWADLILSN